MTEARLALLHELVEADTAIATTLAELDALLRSTAELSERASRLAAVLASAAADRDEAAAAVTLAERDVVERTEALADATAEFAGAERQGDEERLAAARRFHVRARDALAVARKHAEAAREERSSLEGRIAAAERDVPEAEAAAARLAASLRGRPRLGNEAALPPAPGLAGISEWASGTRAALLVARNGVATERDQVIRQANELGSAILGEPLAAGGAAAVARRVEAAVGEPRAAGRAPT